MEFLLNKVLRKIFEILVQAVLTATNHVGKEMQYYSVLLREIAPGISII